MNFLERKKKLILLNNVPSSFIKKDNKYLFRWINHCKENEVLKIRNSFNVVKNLKESKQITAKDHSIFIKNYLSLKRIDFMIEDSKKEILLGGVNLNKTDFGYELGKYIGDENYLGKGIAKKAVSNFLVYIDNSFKEVSKIYAKTRKDNLVNIHINETLGFKISKTLNDDFILMKRSRN